MKPDGSGVLAFGERQLPFLLEYDRGTLDGGDFKHKFVGYHHYYRERAWRPRFAVAPLLLFICSDAWAEARARRAARREAPEAPAWFVSERQGDRTGGREGLLGAVWAGPDEGRPRCAVLGRSHERRLAGNPDDGTGAPHRAQLARTYWHRAVRVDMSLRARRSWWSPPTSSARPSGPSKGRGHTRGRASVVGTSAPIGCSA